MKRFILLFAPRTAGLFLVPPRGRPVLADRPPLLCPNAANRYACAALVGQLALWAGITETPGRKMRSSVGPLLTFAIASLAAVSGCSLGPVDVRVTMGTIHNENYTAGNPTYAAVHLASSAQDLNGRIVEPIVLDYGVENANGVYSRYGVTYSSVIWGGADSDYTYGGLEGYFVLFHDPNKTLLGSNFRVEYLDDVRYH